MKRTVVSSSHIASIGYDTARRVLEVEFLDRSIYQYFGVSESTHRGLMNASSHGRYFDTYVKKAGFSYQRII